MEVVLLLLKMFILKKMKYKAREIINKFADTQDQKESHFNAEAEHQKKYIYNKEFGIYLVSQKYLVI